MRINSMRALKALMCGTLLLASGSLFAAEADAGAEGATQTNWKAWHADFDIANRDQALAATADFDTLLTDVGQMVHSNRGRQLIAQLIQVEADAQVAQNRLIEEFLAVENGRHNREVH